MSRVGGCLEIEALLADYVDQTLSGPDRAAVDSHLMVCPSCQALLADIEAATVFLKKVPEVHPPPELVAKILFETQSGRHGSLPRQGWFRRTLAPIFEPLLQPRLAMGMALTILSLSMVARLTGIQVTEVKAADLQPTRVWLEIENRAVRTWQGVVQKYENLRLVLEIQQRLTEWSESEEETRKADPKAVPEANKPAAERESR